MKGPTLQTININMSQMHKWQVFEDNVHAFETINENKGSFVTMYPHRYTKWLNDFNIFYTLTMPESSLY